jgi:nicotinate-nucleotide pyrophosphorylase
VSAREPTLDRVTVMTAVMQALLDDGAAPEGDPDAVGAGVLLADSRCVIGGLPVVKECFGRLGARFRPLVKDGDRIGPGDAVGELGGPLAAMRGAAPTAIRLLTRLSAIASEQRLPEPDDDLETYAARLSRGEPVGDDGPSFHLEMRD